MELVSSSPRERLEHTIGHLAHFLPAQGPIGVFIHHNTLHAFQHMPFEKAVPEAAMIFDAEPYMTEAAYRAALAKGRIRVEDVEAVLEREKTDAALRRVLLIPGVRTFRNETIHWEIEEEGLLERFRPDLPVPAMRAIFKDTPRALFDFWLTGIPLRNWGATRGLASRQAIDDVVNPLLIKLSSVFLDQGMSYWRMPNRQDGFWAASLELLRQPRTVMPDKMSGLAERIGAWSKLDATSAVIAALESLGVKEPEWEEFLQAELLALPGWAGLMYQLEVDPSLAPHERVPAKLMDFLAVRLLLTASATVPADRSAGIRDCGMKAWRLTQAAILFDAAQLAGHSLSQLTQWTDEQVSSFRSSVLAFGDWERRRVWHEAYERRHERQILLPLRRHASSPDAYQSTRLASQVFFCIDEREESVRRHLEEVDPEVETFGAAGFFGVAMNYVGIDDAHGVALCPVVVKPQHAVAERPSSGHEKTHRRRQELRRAWAMFAWEYFVSSRTLLRGWLGTCLLGIFSLFPLAARVLSPRHFANLIGWLNASVLPEPRTELAFMRSDEPGHQAIHGLLAGFTIQEKIDRVANVLGPAGLRKGMARLVVVLGHGSTSLNNPHESAHDCGACGGRRGGPNGRIFAAMANHPDVRRGLRGRDILIPEDSWFVGGYHDTCNDNIDLYDVEDMPKSHQRDLDRLRASLDEARARSAHERSRRFEAAGDSTRPIDGLHHVQERAEHLAEPRPEYGHCTNSVCIVGRRSTTRGLFFDRRAFLVSYDATLDPTNDLLAAVLGAVIPVCGGISLEYYFSFVDNERYGCGTKLPHNVTGLVGIMNGYEGDLRTGLPWQMVEIHEPVRILFIVETTPDRVLETIRKNPLNWEFLDNRWIRLAVMDPMDGSRIQMYRGNGVWERIEGDDEVLPQVASSLAWYHGHREHLAVARIAAPAKQQAQMQDREMVVS